MKNRAIILLLLLTVISISRSEANLIDDDTKQNILGKWKLLSIEINGKNAIMPKGDYYLTFKSDVVTWSPLITGDVERGQTANFKYLLLTETTPMTLRHTRYLAPNKFVESEDIKFEYGFAIKDKELKIVLDSDDAESLPTEFNSKKGKRAWVAVYQRDSK